jgi:hypothetical protein
MAFDYITDIQPLEQQGLDDTQIAAHLSARTANPFLCSDAKIILEESGAVVEDPVSIQRSGSLIDAYEAMTDQQIKSLIAWFISHVFGRGDQVSSNTYPRSVQVATVIASLPPDLQAVGQQLIDLGNGQPDAGTTAGDVAASRAAYEAEQANEIRVQEIEQLRAEIENDYINPAISDGSSSADQVRENIKAGL